MRSLEDRRLLDEVIISRVGGECKAIRPPFLRRPLPCFTYLHVPSVIRSHTVTIIIVWNVKALSEGVGPRLCCPQEKPLECVPGAFVVLYSTE